MEVTLNIRRLNPEANDPKPYYQDYQVDLEPSSMVLDGLIKIREEIDGSLALRCSCRSAICGSCSMKVNGQARLACNTKITDVITGERNEIIVEPAGNMDVIKDLVVDFTPFWDKIKAIKPWLKPGGSDPGPDREYTAPNDDMLHLAGVMSCIMCGACVSDCTVLEVDDSFIGPAALAKAYRFVSDPRDSADKERLNGLNEQGGIWDCTRCMQCVEVCPKEVDPMGRIMQLRDDAMKAGYTQTYGARHADIFTQMVEHSGRVDELRLPVKTKGIFNIREMIKLIPVAIRAQLNGKVPPLIHKKNPGQNNVKRIFEKVEGDK